MQQFCRTAGDVVGGGGGGGGRPSWHLTLSQAHQSYLQQVEEGSQNCQQPMLSSTYTSMSAVYLCVSVILCTELNMKTGTLPAQITLSTCQ